MPRASKASKFSSTGDPRTRQAASPRWVCSSPQATPSPPTIPGALTSRRHGGTPGSSPSAYPPSPGAKKGVSSKDPHVPLSSAADSQSTLSSPAGSVGKARKRVDVDVQNEGGAQGDSSENFGRIKVAVRVRPFSEKEKQIGARCIIGMSGSQTKILDPAFFDSEDSQSSSEERSMWERTFSFDHSFWSHSSGGRRGGKDLAEGGGRYSSQADVHQSLGEFLLDNACQGFNCSLFAYGQTGSGKTYTMLGDSSNLTSATDEGTAGLIPRICVGLFQRFGLSAAAGCTGSPNNKVQSSIQVSFCEIYNEQVRDLFCDGGGGHGLRVREHPTRGAFVEGLSARKVTCYQQVQLLLEDGMSSRATAATAMNEVSSRSHAIFTIYITVTSTMRLSHRGGADRGETSKDAADVVSSRTSKICLVDLAGSERANATGVKGDRLREAANINKSLSTLGDVIKALAKRSETGRGSPGVAGGISHHESFIPYRNSMLTWLLKDNIGGNSKTVMLAAISPVAEAYQETMSTLRYVERAKEIVNAIVVNDGIDDPLVEKLREEVRGLQELLERKEAAIVEHEEREASLKAALERANADDDGKAPRALAFPNDLEATLEAERREHAASTTAAAEAAAKAEHRYRRELDEQVKAHADALDELAKRYDENLRRVAEEAEEILGEEIAQGKEKAEEAERDGRVYREQKAVAESERARLTDEYRREIDAANKDHEDQMERAGAEVAKATARAAAAEVAISTMRDKHLTQIAEKDAETDIRLTAQLRSLKEEHEKDKQASEDKARETQQSVEAELATKVADAVANAVAISDAARAKELSDVTAQHDAAFIRLSEVHTVAVEAAVAEASERLCSDRDKALAALVDAHHEESKRWASGLSEKEATTRSSLSAEHNEIVERLAEEKARKIEKVVADAEACRVADLAKAADEDAATTAAMSGDSEKVLDVLIIGHDESLQATEKANQAEMEHVVEVEKLRGQAELEAVKTQFLSDIQAIREEIAANQTHEKTHRDILEEVREKHEAEIRRILVKAERKEKMALDAVAEWEKTSEAERAEASAMVASLEAGHKAEIEKIEKRMQEAQQTAKASEEQRMADAEAAERRLLSSISELRAEAAAALAAAENRHEEELRRAEKSAEAEIARVGNTAEARRIADLANAEENHSQALCKYKMDYDAATISAECRHRETLANARTTLEAEIARLIDMVEAQPAKNELDAFEVKEALSLSISTMEKEGAAVVAPLEAQHRKGLKMLQDELGAERGHALEAAEARRICDLDALRKDCDASLAQGEERATATISFLQQEQRAQLARLEREKAEEEERGAAHVSEVESRWFSSVEAIRVEAAEEKAALVARHLVELRKVKEEEATQLERISAEVTQRYAAQEATNARATSELRTKHLRAVQAMMMEREEAVTAAEVEAQEVRKAFEELRERHQGELRQRATEKEAANARAVAEALADAEASSARTLSETINTIETEHAALLQRERESYAEAIDNIKTALTASETEAKALVETLKEENQNAMNTFQEVHGTSLREMEDARRQEIEELGRRVDTAETEMADAKATAAELATRASALEEMLQASVGSKEDELVGHRSRVAQFQAFVARRRALSEGGNSNASEHEAAVPALSMQQRVVDLRAIASSAGVGGLNVGEHEMGFAAFAGTLRGEGLTMERYAEELEGVLVKATVEAVAARQDYLEAEMQHQRVMRQLVGLKLVHAQVRECLEDTRAKLELKSQSAVRRLLNSATRLAHEFTKDRFSSPSTRAGASKSASPKTKSRQTNSQQGSGKRSPSWQAKEEACARDGGSPSPKALAERKR